MDTIKGLVLTVDNQIKAYNQRDITQFMACFHPDIKLLKLSQDQPVASGLEAVEAIYRDLFASSPLLQCTIMHRSIHGEFIIDEESVKGAKKYPDGLSATVIYQLKDSLIYRVWFVG